MKRVVIVKFVVFIVLILSVVYYIDSQSPVCVSGKIESLGDAQYSAQINIDVSKFNEPSSFIIISDLVQGRYISSSPEFLFTQNKSGQASWLFGQSFLPIRDSQLNYTFNSPDLNKHSHYLVSGLDPENPDVGYKSLKITEEKQCI